MTRVDFIFDNTPHYALYEIVSSDGTDEYYLELRDRSLITEFGLAITFRTTPAGRLRPAAAHTPRTIDLLETILRSINPAAASR